MAGNTGPAAFRLIELRVEKVINIDIIRIFTDFTIKPPEI